MDETKRGEGKRLKCELMLVLVAKMPFDVAHAKRVQPILQNTCKSSDHERDDGCQGLACFENCETQFRC